MTFKEIIDANVNRFHVDWPRYAFHMAGIDNALNILSEGYIYSRNKAMELGKMQVDNASQGVIDNTVDDVKAYARFYFRPKTPTYYHFEGYHQEGLRYQNDNHVNMPLPVLFLFDLESLLSDERTVFNGIKASGNNYNPLRGVEAFNSLQFDKIYHDTWTKDKAIYDYRHAEVLYPEQYPIERSLKRIICRNQIEAVSLKRLLRLRNPEAIEKWGPIIQVNASYFNLSGLRVIDTSVKKQDDTMVMRFKLEGHNDYYSYIKNKNVINYTPLEGYPRMDYVFDVRFENRPYHHTFTAHIDLTKPDTFSGGDPIPDNAKKILLSAYFDREANIAFSVTAKIEDGIKQFKLILDCSEAMEAFPTKPGQEAPPLDEVPFGFELVDERPF